MTRFAKNNCFFAFFGTLFHPLFHNTVGTWRLTGAGISSLAIFLTLYWEVQFRSQKKWILDHALRPRNSPENRVFFCFKTVKKPVFWVPIYHKKSPFFGTLPLFQVKYKLIKFKVKIYSFKKEGSKRGRFWTIFWHFGRFWPFLH